MLKKLTNKKGFTLMEMLIVVAIIAILVAIAIPTFNSSLNKARVATDEANIRAIYAEQMVKYIDVLAEGKDGTAVTAVTYTTVGKNETAVSIGGVGNLTWDAGATVSIAVTADGVGTITVG